MQYNTKEKMSVQQSTIKIQQHGTQYNNNGIQYSAVTANGSKRELMINRRLKLPKL